MTPAQIAAFCPPRRKKPGDRRGTVIADAVQAEALAPDELGQIITDATEAHIDLDVPAAVRAEGEDERREILAELTATGI